MINQISASSINPIKAFTAVNAFKDVQNTSKNSQNIEDNTSSGVDLKDNNNLLQNQNLDEIKNIATIVGKIDLTNEEIKYGLTYGRSVMADYCC